MTLSRLFAGAADPRRTSPSIKLSSNDTLDFSGNENKIRTNDVLIYVLMESSMAASPSYSGAADKAMAFAAQLRADRERHEARRREEQRRIEAMRPINKHVLKVFGGQQLALKLNS
ncbi:hypothetical protein [Rhizobium mesosinicum]|nr:hypothetical protein [Rhizobium mesosinicum]